MRTMQAEEAKDGLLAKMPEENYEKAVLKVRDLEVRYRTLNGAIPVLRGVDLDLRRGETLAIVGESGSGKSTMAMALMGLLNEHSAILSGSVAFQGQEMIDASERVLRQIQLSGLAMVFQNADDSLDPVFTIGNHLREVLRQNRKISRQAADAEAAELLTSVGITSSVERLGDYPHQFSGGMRQRAAIALALAMKPRVLIADEPTTALDVTVQAGILALISRLVDESGMSLIFVTHDLTVSRKVAEQLLVMYAGEVVEVGRLKDVFARPAHPYTAGLIACHPASLRRGERLKPIPGSPPSNLQEVRGCAFAPRCSWAQDICRSDAPPLTQVADGRQSRCHFAEEVLNSESR